MKRFTALLAVMLIMAPLTMTCADTDPKLVASADGYITGTIPQGGAVEKLEIYTTQSWYQSGGIITIAVGGNVFELGSSGAVAKTTKPDVTILSAGTIMIPGKALACSVYYVCDPLSKGDWNISIDGRDLREAFFVKAVLPDNWNDSDTLATTEPLDVSLWYLSELSAYAPNDIGPIVSGIHEVSTKVAEEAVRKAADPVTLLLIGTAFLVLIGIIVTTVILKKRKNTAAEVARDEHIRIENSKIAKKKKEENSKLRAASKAADERTETEYIVEVPDELIEIQPDQEAIFEAETTVTAVSPAGQEPAPAAPEASRRRPKFMDL